MTRLEPSPSLTAPATRSAPSPPQAISPRMAAGGDCGIGVAIHDDVALVTSLLEAPWRGRRHPAAFLTPTELSQLATYDHEQRRWSFLAGRWAAKEAVRARWPNLSPKEFEILNSAASEDRGRPFVWSAGGDALGHVSISHCRPLASAAFSAAGALGVDVERVEQRSVDFRRTAFTAEEVAWIEGSTSERAPLLETLLWTAKEAVSKCLGVGLSAPLERIRLALAQVDPRDTADQLGHHRGLDWPMGSVGADVDEAGGSRISRLSARVVDTTAGRFVRSLATPSATPSFTTLTARSTEVAP